MRHRLLPHPDVTIVLDFGAAPPVVDDGADHLYRGSLVAGLGFGGAASVQGSDISCVQVRLSPAVARTALGVPLAELDNVVELEQLWGRETRRISERLAATESWQRRFALVDELLASRCADGPPPSAELDQAWHRIVACRGRLRVDRLAGELDWSRNRLWSSFRSHFGLSPKRAATLVRFDHAAHRLAAGHQPAVVAAESGYADQSHLHRDVRDFAGVTPTAVRDESFLAVDALAWPAASDTVAPT